MEETEALRIQLNAANAKAKPAAQKAAGELKQVEELLAEKQRAVHKLEALREEDRKVHQYELREKEKHLEQMERELTAAQTKATEREKETDALRVQLKATKSKVAGFGFATQKANAMSVKVTAVEESLQAERSAHEKTKQNLKHMEKELTAAQTKATETEKETDALRVQLKATKSKSRRMWFFVCAMVCALCAWVLSTLIRADGAVYEGDWKGWKQHGKGKMTYTQGKLTWAKGRSDERRGG